MDKREKRLFILSQFSPLFLLFLYRYVTDRFRQHLALFFAFSLIHHSCNYDYTSGHQGRPSFFPLLLPYSLSFLIRRRTQHGEMKVKAAHYFFTSEQEQNQMFHICSCSLQHYHEKAKGVFQCSTAHCFRMEMETSVKTPACLCQMSP